MRLEIEVVIWRGSIAESRHRVQAAVSDPAGRLVAATADAHAVTTFRSAAKPFQLLPLVERGHADRFGFDDETLAVMAASHTGSAYHLDLVRRILARLELEDRHLACGFHEPLDPDSRELLVKGAAAPSPLYNNCSGKHAGMLALALAEGWPVEGYERADHPVQRLMRVSVAQACGLEAEELAVAVDGCSVSVFALPLSAMARGYARLATATDQDEPRGRALARIRAAMQSHPRAVGGGGRLSSALMEVAGRHLVAKGGAEGLECLGLLSPGLGLAVKCEDGQTRAVGPAVVALLTHLGHLSERELGALEAWRTPVLHNYAGHEVGRIEATVRPLAAVTAPA
jgi:L-asparaginase II